MLSRPTLVFVYEILFLHMITGIKNRQKGLEKERPFRIDERNIVDAFPMIIACCKGFVPHPITFGIPLGVE